MRVLSCSLRAATLRAALIEGSPTGPAVHAFLERPVEGGDVAVALRELLLAAQTKDVAFALAPPDVAIARLAGGTDLHPGDLRRAARLRAEALGFQRDDPFQVVWGRSGMPYFGVARRGALAYLTSVCRSAGARLRYVDHEGYAWAAAMGSRAQALVLVDDDAVRLVIAGAEQVHLGSFPWQVDGRVVEPSAIAATIADAFVEASKAGFADVDAVLADDPDERIVGALRARLAATTIASFALDLDPARTPWALACGLGSRAVGRATRRINCNFAPRAVTLASIGSRLAPSISLSDLSTVAVGVAAAAALVTWRAESLRELQDQSTMLERRLAGARSEGANVDRVMRNLALARGAIVAVEDARESAPLAARDLAGIVARMRPDLSLTSLTGDANGWSVAGHARTYGSIAMLVEILASSGYQPSVGSLSESDGRIAYALTLRRARSR